MVEVSEAQLLAWITPLLWPFLRTLALFTAMPVLDASCTVSWTKGAGYSGAYGTDYVVETSVNLIDWDPVPMGEVGIGATVDYTIPDDEPQRFARLKVTGP